MTPAEHRESATQYIRAAVIELHQVGIPYDQIIGTVAGYARRHMVKLQALGLVDAVTRLRKCWRGIFNERVWHVTERGSEILKTED